MVKQIIAEIATGRGPGAGTDGDVYLGIGGREFHANIRGYDDFEEDDEAVYAFGQDANVDDADMNDPRTHRSLTMANVRQFPAYIRFSPRNGRDTWMLEQARVKVHGTSGETISFVAMDAGESLWLGMKSGLIVYLRQV